MMASIIRRGRRQPGPIDGVDSLRRGFVSRWWPLGPPILSGLLIALAVWLDTGGPRERDAALLIGSLALYLLLPLSLLVAAVVVALRIRSQRRTA